MNASDRLVDMRRVAERIAQDLLTRLGSQVEAVMVEGSVARGDIHEHSDIDLVVFLDPVGLSKGRASGLSLAESLEVRGYHVDIGYGLLDDALAELSQLYGPDWEKQSSFFGDALILYDREGRLARAKRQNRFFSKKMRQRNAKRVYDNMLDLDEAAGTAWRLGNYREASIFCSMYAERCLRIVFPLFGRKSCVDKRLLEHAVSLIDDPRISAQILMLLCHPSEAEEGTRRDAARRLDAVVAIKEWVVAQARKAGIQDAVPGEGARVLSPGESLRTDSSSTTSRPAGSITPLRWGDIPPPWRMAMNVCWWCGGHDGKRRTGQREGERAAFNYGPATHTSQPTEGLGA